MVGLPVLVEATDAERRVKAEVKAELAVGHPPPCITTVTLTGACQWTAAADALIKKSRLAAPPP